MVEYKCANGFSRDPSTIEIFLMKPGSNLPFELYSS